MRVYILGKKRLDIGGGFTFIRNLQKSLPDVTWVDNWRDAELYFIPSCSLISDREEVSSVSKIMPVVLRIDNLPKESNNRGKAFASLEHAAFYASDVIYQTQWAKEYVGYFLRDFFRKFRKHVIINGVDPEIFNTHGRPFKGKQYYLFINRAGEENKRFPEAWFRFHYLHRDNPSVSLRLVGGFQRCGHRNCEEHNQIERYTFNFVDGESIQYLGILDDVEMAALYRQTDVLLAPYYMDACSNTVIEALMCGCDVDPCLSGMTGGTPEIIAQFKKDPKELTIESMGKKYEKVFAEAIAGANVKASTNRGVTSSPL